MSKTIAIVGAGLGVGLAIGERFGREGFKVVLLARNTDKLSDLQSKFQQKEIETTFFQADVTDRASLEKA